MVKITVISPDLARLGKKMRDLTGDGFKKEVHESIRKVLPAIHRDAYENCPKDTGILSSSLNVGFEDETTGFIADGVFYGVFQEEGTRSIEPKHFMRNAVNRNFPRVENEVTASIKKKFNQ